MKKASSPILWPTQAGVKGCSSGCLSKHQSDPVLRVLLPKYRWGCWLLTRSFRARWMTSYEFALKTAPSCTAIGCDQGIAPTNGRSVAIPPSCNTRLRSFTKGSIPTPSSRTQMHGSRSTANVSRPVTRIVTCVARDLEPYRGFHTLYAASPSYRRSGLTPKSSSSAVMMSATAYTCQKGKPTGSVTVPKSRTRLTGAEFSSSASFPCRLSQSPAGFGGTRVPDLPIRAFVVDAGGDGGGLPARCIGHGTSQELSKMARTDCLWISLMPRNLPTDSPMYSRGTRECIQCASKPGRPSLIITISTQFACLDCLSFSPRQGTTAE